MRTEIHVGWGSFSRLAWKHQDFLIKHYNKNARNCAFPVLMRGQTICSLCIYVSVTLIYSQTVAVFLGPVHGHSHLSICKHESNKLNNKLDHNFLICSPSCWTWPGGRCLKSRKEKSLCRKSPPSATVAPRVRVWILMLGTKPDIMWFTVRLLPFFLLQWVTYWLILLPLCLFEDSEPPQRMTCGRGTGLCMSTVRRTEGTPAPRVPNIREDVFWSRFCCVNAILLVSVNIFLYAYFAWVVTPTSSCCCWISPKVLKWQDL